MLYGYSVYMLTKLVICSGHLFARIDQSALECPHFTYPSLHACHQERRTDEVIMSTMSGALFVLCFIKQMERERLRWMRADGEMQGRVTNISG